MRCWRRRVLNMWCDGGAQSNERAVTPAVTPAILLPIVHAITALHGDGGRWAVHQRRTRNVTATVTPARRLVLLLLRRRLHRRLLLRLQLLQLRLQPSTSVTVAVAAVRFATTRQR